MFASELRILKEQAGKPPLKELVRQASIQVPPVSLSNSTLSDWFNGRSAPDAKPPFAFVLQFLHGRAVARGHSDLYGIDWYETLRSRAWDQKAAARGGRPGRPRPRLAADAVAQLPTVAQVNPLLLGVHRPIRVRGHDDSALPPYIRRDLDHGAGGLRSQFRAASAGTGGFFLLVGGSSVGKTRTLYEALLDSVPNWQLLHPEPGDEMAATFENVPHRLVVWLDELHHHLAGQSALSASSVRTLLGDGALIVGTMGPAHYSDFTALPATGDMEDRHRGKRELLKLATICYLGSEFSAREWNRATATARKSAAAGDRRLQVALNSSLSGLKTQHVVHSASDSSGTPGTQHEKAPRRSKEPSKSEGLEMSLTEPGELSAVQSRALLWFSDQTKAAQSRVPAAASRFGLTQTMAAAPQLVERWRSADEQDMPYARAVLTAAVDLARLGVTSALTPELLKAAAWGYCTAQQRARALPHWFDEALTYTTRTLLGATSALIPVMVGADEDQTICYHPADYLLERIAEERTGTCPPPAFWQACVRHVSAGSELLAMGHAAADRLRYRYAVPLLTGAFEAGEREAYGPLTSILLAQDKVADLMILTRDHETRHGQLPTMAIVTSAHTMADRGYADEALALLWPKRDNEFASFLVARICDESGHLSLLAHLSDEGSDWASSMLAARFLDGGQSLLDLVSPYLAALKDAATTDTGGTALPEIDRERTTQVGELLDLLFGEKPSGHPGDLLSIEADADIVTLVEKLQETSGALIAEARRLFDLREAQQASRSHGKARPPVPLSPEHVARNLEEGGDLKGALKALDAAGGDRKAERTRSSLLHKHGQNDAAFEGLRKLAESGDYNSTIRLSELLVASGRTEEALDLLRDRDRAGDPFVFVWLDFLLEEQGRIEELELRAIAGDQIALERLSYAVADHLAAEGQHQDAFTVLRWQADTGMRMAARDLLKWLRRHNRTEEAERLERWGIGADGSIATAPQQEK
ncbi:hypothetical protein [Streptomyces sp. NPDC055794]